MAQDPVLERLGGGQAFTGFLAAQPLTPQLPLHISPFHLCVQVAQLARAVVRPKSWVTMATHHALWLLSLSLLQKIIRQEEDRGCVPLTHQVWSAPSTVSGSQLALNKCLLPE